MHHRHRYLRNLNGHAKRNLVPTNTCHQILGRIHCLHNHHYPHLPIAYGCMGISPEYWFQFLPIRLRHNNQAHGYHQMNLYLNPRPVSNLLDIYLQSLHRQPSHPGHNHHSLDYPTMTSHRHLSNHQQHWTIHHHHSLHNQIRRMLKFLVLKYRSLFRALMDYRRTHPCQNLPIDFQSLAFHHVNPELDLYLNH